ncbi:putative had-superfamily hydrolase subfamily ia variant 3 [Phaeomoniella chlamydospora]|uniref:Putative had-superfamily hydrolase subfamily ia variant 3 n=1 Tax=Phaeomoniella chlamydospora TaxID=158046 RepID=A0A0G2E8R2_PHACM|nr:putative had-superfamily hydrolase subfamily ia variant 3 [Phaeomoniella chlamydospora]
MSNMSKEDWAMLQKHTEFNWSIFDGAFTSGEVGMRKPELRFYRHVLEMTKSEPEETIFVDDKSENILAARSLGITGIQFNGTTKFFGQILNLVGNPIQRGQDYLSSQGRKPHSLSNTGHALLDNFTQFLLLEVTSQEDLVDIADNKRTWNFFIGEPFATTANYPDDLDTTSVALMQRRADPAVADSIMDEMLSLRSEDGIIMTYFDNTRQRVDPVVCVNVVRLFHSYGRGDDPKLESTKDWIHNVLLYRAYVDGTRYYLTSDVFLFFFARLIAENKGSEIYVRNGSLLRERLRERINADGDPLALAMRIIACDLMNLRDDIDLGKLLAMQSRDGSWEKGWLCRYGKSNIMLENRSLTTALAMNAIQRLHC